MSNDELRITVDEDGPPSEAQALQARLSFEEAVRRTLGATVSVKVGAITQQLADTYEKVTAAIKSLPKESHGCSLQTVSFTLTVSSSGEVSLPSTVKGQLQGQTGLTFTVSKVS